MPDFGGDTLKRTEVSPGVYQCGCKWRRDPDFGDVLDLCPIHAAWNRTTWEKWKREHSEEAARLCAPLQKDDDD